MGALTDKQKAALARVADGRIYSLDGMAGSVRSALYKRGLIESVVNSVTGQFFLRITADGLAEVSPGETTRERD